MLKLPASEVSDLQMQFIKGEIWPEKMLDKMRLSDVNPILFVMGWVVFAFGMFVGMETGEMFYGISLLFLGVYFIFAEILTSIQTSCILSNYQSMYHSGILEFEVPVLLDVDLSPEEEAAS